MNTGPTASIASGLQGLQAAGRRAGEAAERIVGGDIDARSIVDLKQAETDFKANAGVIRTADRMLGKLLDMFA